MSDEILRKIVESADGGYCEKCGDPLKVCRCIHGNATLAGRSLPELFVDPLEGARRIAELEVKVKTLNKLIETLFSAGDKLDDAVSACVFSIEPSMSERGRDECAAAQGEWQTLRDKYATELD